MGKFIETVIYLVQINTNFQMLKFTTFLLLTLVCLLPLNAQENELKTSASKIVTYKKIADTELKAYIFNPPNHQKTDKKAAIIFFFGGG